MARPVPFSMFLTDLAIWVQKNLAGELQSPVLLAAEPWANFALIGSQSDHRIYVLDRRQGKLTMKLALPVGTRHATDFRRFLFSFDGLNVVAYNPKDYIFAAWALADGNLIHESKGVGQITPAMAFLTGGRVAVCDGPKVMTWQLEGELLHTSPVSDDLRSLVLFAPPSTKMVLIGVGVFRKGLGSLTLHSFRMENGAISGRQDGPIRPRPESQHDKRTVTLHELQNIPGSTARILIVSEEERLEKRAPLTDWEYDYEYTTRLMAIDPAAGRFHKGELEIEGRHCLQGEGGDLFLIDEMGRKRLITGFPLRLEKADWRLTG